VLPYKVKAGSAVDRGKAGPLGRKFKVDFETPSGLSVSVVFPKEDVAAWVDAMNAPCKPTDRSQPSVGISPSAPTGDLPYDGDMNAAMRAQVRCLRRHLMAAGANALVSWPRRAPLCSATPPLILKI